jgi:hypothetical protein
MSFSGDIVGVMVEGLMVDFSVETAMGEAGTVAVGRMSVGVEVFGMDVEMMLQPVNVIVSIIWKINFLIILPLMDKKPIYRSVGLGSVFKPW